ncbi:cytochrome P450 PksS [Archangium gephyra]|uniref:Cytochrome P450 PksS n=1 Tax=Archangium gephyra TaxID=48 RepID=A0AAC8QGE2_9BACT|nr:cytochrome P450 [Archangium gephyra]AKJ06959.1 putative cytochrome P450 hydroxylase [Archangium gephyra]REG31753.1 cytochrome P450 PksS [Archangium gephyra]
MQTLTQPDFKSQRFKANPFPFYARLREEAPVFRIKVPANEAGWLVTRYDDVNQVLKHGGISKDRIGSMTPEQQAKMPWFFKFFTPLVQNMLSRDPPDHTRLRALVHKAFTPRLIERLRSRVQTLSDSLLDTAARKGSMDLVAEYAFLLPVTIIAEMLGVPPGDYKKFQHWSNRLVSNTDMSDVLLSIPSVVMFTRYLRKLIAQRRTSLGDDLLSALIQAEEAGDKLTGDELVSMAFLLLVAGHETTVNLISGGTLALLQHPEQLERLRKEPGLIEPAVEELLRYASPVEVATERIARDGVTVSGVTIPRGDLVFAVLASANRDERHFKDPNTLDLGRDPNKHVSFGMGIHYCLGAPLARLEGQIAIQTLVNRFPNLRLSKPAESLKWRTGVLMRGPKQLPVKLT